MLDGKNLPVLTSSNFTSWKIRVQGYCMQHGYYKFLNNPNPPADAAALADWEDKKIKANKSSSVQNQLIVYQEFLALTYKNSVGTFLDKLDARLSGMAAVGLVVEEPEKANIKESLLCKAILAKLPAKFAAAKEILYQKRPLKITIIRECLESKKREAAAPSTTPAVIKQEANLKAKTQPSKSNAKKDYPRCSAGWHNPKTVSPRDTSKNGFLM
ncbi:hypothetical protein PCASD_15755 [Puccinia coronata f. sp. avenae]|uniref:DUF4219 domain-containing protein n=1 Tax=Puccinia coronata f. sp. avenae TaxID=200324 RepID=A0A2N5U768_9BASI|nr:hypothetical protein PCASD_15755 [Puccinia coronata f. sp. avenae]